MADTLYKLEIYLIISPSQTGVVLLYCLPTVSTYYITVVEPWTTPVILPLTQVAMTGGHQLFTTNGYTAELVQSGDPLALVESGVSVVLEVA